MKEKYIIERPSKHGTTLQIRIRYNGQTFSRTIRVSDYPTKKQAMTHAKMIRDKQLTVMQSSRRNTLKESPTIKQRYLRKWETSGLSTKTKERQDAIYTHLLQPIENRKLSDISIGDIQQSLITYSENHTQGQLDRARAIWKQLYQTAFLLGYDILDLTPRIAPIRSKIPSRHRNTTTTPETFKTFSDALISYGDKKTSTDVWYLLQIMYHTGCRIGEALALSKEDYNPIAKTISINKAIGSTPRAKRTIITTKTKYSVRNIPLNPEACSLFDNLIAYSDTEPLLTDKDGKPYDVDKVSNFIRNVSQKAGIQFNAYQLRHLFSTELFRSGESPAVIRDLMGHSSRAMSLNYASSTEEEKARAIEKLSGQTRDKNNAQ